MGGSNLNKLTKQEPALLPGVKNNLTKRVSINMHNRHGSSMSNRDSSSDTSSNMSPGPNMLKNPLLSSKEIKLLNANSPLKPKVSFLTLKFA